MEIISTAEPAKDIAIQDVLPPSLFDRVRKQLFNNVITKAKNLFEQVQEGWRLRSYSTLLGRNTRDEAPPKWFQAISEAEGEIGQRIEAAQAARVAVRSNHPPTPLSAEMLMASKVNQDGIEQDMDRAVPVDDTGVTVWTDGSVDKNADGVEHGGYAAVIFPPGETASRPTPNAQQPDVSASMVCHSPGQDELTPVISIAGKYAGPACDSNMLEALAVAHAVHALAHLPPNVPITIYTDSQNTVRWWRMFAMAPLERERYARQCISARKPLALAAKIAARRPVPIQVEWVRGHSGIHGNEVADRLARKAAQTTSPLVPSWSMNRTQSPDGNFELLIKGINHLRRPEVLLSQQTAHRRRLEGAARLRRHTQQSQDEPATVRHRLLMPAAASSDGTEPVDAPRRFVAQLAAGMLPTMARNTAWLGTVFQHAHCRRCNAAEETWQHVLVCSKNGPEALGRIVNAGRRCLRRLTANEFITRNFPVRQTILDTAFLIGCVSDGYMAALEGLPVSRAQRTIDSLIRTIRHGVYYEIWRPRCIETRAALKQEGITWSRGNGWQRSTNMTNTLARQSNESARVPTTRPDGHNTGPHKININEVNRVAFKTNNYAKYGFW